MDLSILLVGYQERNRAKLLNERFLKQHRLATGFPLRKAESRAAEKATGSKASSAKSAAGGYSWHILRQIGRARKRSHGISFKISRVPIPCFLIPIPRSTSHERRSPFVLLLC